MAFCHVASLNIDVCVTVYEEEKCHVYFLVLVLICGNILHPYVERDLSTARP